MPLTTLVNPSADRRDDGSRNLDVLAEGTGFAKILYTVMRCQSLQLVEHPGIEDDHTV